MKKRILFFVLFFKIAFSFAQVPYLKGGSQWQDNFGNIYYKDDGDKLKLNRTDYFTYQTRAEQKDMVHAFFGNCGLAIEFINGGGWGLTGLKYGTANYFRIFLGAALTQAKVTASGDYPDKLPFGFKLNASIQEVEQMIGKITLYQDPNFIVIKYAEYKNLPGYDGFYLKLEFIDNKLVAIGVRTTQPNQWSVNKDKFDVSLSFLKKSITNNNILRTKLHYTNQETFFKTALSDVKKEQNIVNANHTLQQIKEQLASDSLLYEVHPSGNVLRSIWCMDELDSKEAFYERLDKYMNLFFNPKYDKVTDHSDVLAPYVEDKNYSEYETYFCHYDDKKNYKTANAKPVIHIYWKPSYNEVVLEIAEPAIGEGASEKRFEKKYYKICTPTDPNLLYTDEEYKKKFLPEKVDINPAYHKTPADALLLLLYEPFASDFINTQIFYNQRGFAWPTDYKLESFGFTMHLTRDKEKSYVRSRDNCYIEMISFQLDDYPGELPFGLKKGMTVKKMQSILPGLASSSDKKGYTKHYYTFKITPELNYSIVFGLRDGKLIDMDIRANAEHGQRGYNVQKKDILPVFTQAILGF